VSEEQNNVPDETTTDSTPPRPLDRETLYKLVWSEPMLKVAARYNVSSSYLARICTRMNVPRPERGYWAKLAVGRAQKQPPLPEPAPGDELAWAREGEEAPVKRLTPRPPTRKCKNKAKPKLTPSGFHPHIVGAKDLFAAGRTSYGGEYLKPSKRLLVDLAVTKSGLDRALDFANQLFWALEESGFNVVFAPTHERFCRAEVDIHEKPKKKTGYEHSNLWEPNRCTVVYVGTVAIGLRVIEMCEEAEGRYVNGEFVREKDYVPKGSRYSYDYSRPSTRDVPAGRLRLQAFSPYHRAHWVKQWQETEKRDLVSQIKKIVRELKAAAVEIAKLVEEAAHQAEIEHQRWLVEREQMRLEEIEEKKAESRKESLEDLFQVISDWDEVNRIEKFFSDVEKRVHELNEGEKHAMLERLRLARDLIGSTDALEHFLNWKSPDERFKNKRLYYSTKVSG
jgi:molecular chaperone GrpE (heat shock protein)